MHPAGAVECVSGWIGQRANAFCQSGLHRASLAWVCVIKYAAAADSTLVGKLFLSALREEGGRVVGRRQRGATYCRFRSYSCGSTVIIPPPPSLNSLILSYISRARDQEILQYINRSTLCKGDYCMAYILTSLFRIKDFFAADSLSYLVSVSCSAMPDWVLSRGSVTATQSTRRVTCSVFA